MVRIYPVLVLKNTKLEREYISGEYQPISLNQAIERCKELVYMFNKKKINVIRIGLQNTDIISEPGSKESEVVAGPYHPAFGQLVADSIWYDSIVYKIKKFNVKVKKIKIEVNPLEVNNVVGHKKENILKLKEIYDVDIIVIGNEKIKLGKSKINIEETYLD